MNQVCEKLHHYVNCIHRFTFPIIEHLLPNNGVYILFQKNEPGHGHDRIVRVGAHTGMNQLRSRLKQHFIQENKDRSIFRKNIGRCLLHSEKHPYLEVWEKDLTTRKMKNVYGHLVDSPFQQMVEKRITLFLQENFSFCVIQEDDKDRRLWLESKIISTVSQCNECGPSSMWLGLHSPKEKIRESGLWQVNELYKEPFIEHEWKAIEKTLK